MTTISAHTRAAGSAPGATNASMRRQRLLIAAALLLAGMPVVIWVHQFSTGDAANGAPKGITEWFLNPWTWWLGTWWLGMPILYVSLALSVTAFIAIIGAYLGHPKVHNTSWAVTIAASIAMILTSIWYVFVLSLLTGYLRGSIWCIVPLMTNMSAAIILLASTPTPNTLHRLGYTSGPHGFILSKATSARSMLAGIVIAGVVIGGAWIGTPPLEVQALSRLSQVASVQMLEEGSRRLLVPEGGRAIVDLGQTPVLGSPQAPYVIYHFFDYTEPASRHSYLALRDAQQRYGDQIAVFPLVWPLDNTCNPRVSKNASINHPGAGRYARLSLAVWRADKTKYKEFHEFLITPRYSGRSHVTPQLDGPVPTLLEAEAYAENLIGSIALDRAMNDPWVMEQLRIHINAKSYQAVDVDEFAPQTFWLRKRDTDNVYISAGIVGPVRSSAELFEALEMFLGVKPVHSEVAEDDVIMHMLH